MSRKNTKFCLSWPNKTLEIFGHFGNIGILLTERTIIPYSNLICRSARLLIMIMIIIILLDDLETQKVPGIAMFSPAPGNRRRTADSYAQLISKASRSVIRAKREPKSTSSRESSHFFLFCPEKKDCRK